MKRNSVTSLPLMMLMIFFSFGCSSLKQSNSDKSQSPVKVKTKITPEVLKTRLSGKKVTSLEPVVGEKNLGRIGHGMWRLKIVSGETPPKVDLNGEVYEFNQLRAKLRDRFQPMPDEDADRSVRLAASESDIAFYNERGISVEDFEWLIANLDDGVNHFEIDFIGMEIPKERSPQSGSPPLSIKPRSVGDYDEPPPLRKKSTPK